ncbi:MAG: hypothetical protein EA425_00775 [Puniceicoccaceae bacterium]|nr:MAG: hypothetical protein EA425_00775 [Puniceicoccaceae bacterium]
MDTIATALGEMDNRGTILLLALIGFGVKAGAVPLYFWLPLAHPVAPTPASAVLSGSMIKAGLIGWLHFSPLQADALPGWPTACILLGLVAAFGAVAVGLAQRDLKTILAYSSISQMGVMTLIFGLALGAGAESGTVVAVLALYALNHGLAKGALFLGTALHPKAEGARIGLLAGLTVAALAIAGAPFTGGARTKYAAKTMLDHAPQGWEGPLLTLLAASAFGTALLLGRFLWLSTRPLSQASKPPPSVGAFPWILLLAAVLTLPHWAAGLTAASIPAAPLSAGALAEAAWPILLAALVLATAAIASQRRWLRLHLPKIPPGDLIVPIEHLIRRTALAHWWRLGLIYPERGAINFEARVDRLLALDHSRSATDRAESWLVQWRVAGAGFILILFLLVLFL